VGEKADLIKAAEVIKKAIKGFVRDDEHNNIDVFESSAGHLRVIVGSDVFKDKGPVERQNMIWDYLKNKVPREHLVYCFGVHTMNAAEYEEARFPESAAESMGRFTDGRIPLPDDADG